MLYISGRYNKYSRTLSQTPWVIEGQRKSESSVEELICTEIDKAFRPTGMIYIVSSFIYIHVVLQLLVKIN